MACFCQSSKDRPDSKGQPQTPDSSPRRRGDVTKASLRVVASKIGVKLDPNVPEGAIVRALADSPGQLQVRPNDVLVSIGGQSLDDKDPATKLKIAENQIAAQGDGQLEVEIIRGVAPAAKEPKASPQNKQQPAQETAGAGVTDKNAPVNAGKINTADAEDNKRQEASASGSGTPSVAEGKWDHVKTASGETMDAAAAAARADALIKVFKVTDADHSGGISLEELQSIGTWWEEGAQSGKKVTPEQYVLIFQALDVNKNNQVEIDEFLQYFMLRMAKMTDEAFHKCCKSVGANMEAEKSEKEKHREEAKKFLENTEEEESKAKAAKAEAETKAKAKAAADAAAAQQAAEEEAKAAEAKAAEAKAAEAKAEEAKAEAEDAEAKAEVATKSAEAWAALKQLKDTEETREKWLYQLFQDCDTDNSGGLDINEFFRIGEMWQKLKDEAEGTETPYTEEMNRAAFNILDTSGNGILEDEEFKEFYLVQSEGMSWETFCEGCNRIMATF